MTERNTTMNKHLLGTTLAAGLLAAVALASPADAAPSDAGGASLGFYPEDYDAYEHHDAGEGICVDWAVTFHEVRHGGYRLVSAPGGQVPGELHVNGAIDGLIELIPDDAALPTYTGTYREKINGIVVDSSLGDATPRIAQYRLTSTLQGSDGSTMELRLSGKVTVNGEGRLVVTRDELTCA
jgi:hypothetical protein